MFKKTRLKHKSEESQNKVLEHKQIRAKIKTVVGQQKKGLRDFVQARTKANSFIIEAVTWLLRQGQWSLWLSCPPHRPRICCVGKGSSLEERAWCWCWCGKTLNQKIHGDQAVLVILPILHLSSAFTIILPVFFFLIPKIKQAHC